MDTSISVDALEWDDLRRYIQDVVDSLAVGPQDSQIGFVSYSNFAQLCANLNKYPDKSSAINGIWNDIVHLAHITNTDKGLQMAATQCFGGPGDRPDHDNLAILLTDGLSHGDVTSAANTLRKVASVVAIGIDGAKDYQLSQIVNNDASRWFMVDSFSELNGRVGQLMASTCRKYRTAPFRTLPCPKYLVLLCSMTWP